jgi:N-acetylneuraminic acid mutarotase
MDRSYKKHIILVIGLIYFSVFSYGQCNWIRKNNTPFSPNRDDAVSRVIGNKAYVGLGKASSSMDYFNDFWEYDITNDVWTQKASFGGAPRTFAASFVIGNKMYVIGGSSQFISYNDVWEYDPSLDKWTQKANFPSAFMAFKSWEGFSIGSKGYLYCGISGGGVNQLWEYDPNADQWVRKRDFPSTQRWYFTVCVAAGKAYLGLGSYAKRPSDPYDPDPYKRDFWEYDPATDIWTQKANFIGEKRQGAVGFVINNKIIVGLGGANSLAFTDMWEYDLVTNSWDQIENFGGRRRRNAFSFSNGTVAYVGHGWENGETNDFWKYEPYDNGIAPPTAVDQSFCGEARIYNLLATPPDGCTINWYQYPSGGSKLESYINLSSGFYYAESRNTTTLCRSTTRTPVKVTLNEQPTPPVSNNQSFCSGIPLVSNLNTSPPANCVVNWYNLPSEGSILDLNSLLNSGYYYAEAKNTQTGCISATRTKIFASVGIPGTAGIISGPDIVNFGQTDVVYSVEDIPGVSEYHWSFPSGATIISGEGTNTVTANFASNASNGNISVYGSNGCGNGLNVTKSIIVTPISIKANQEYFKRSTCTGNLTNINIKLSTTMPCNSYAWYRDVNSNHVLDETIDEFLGNEPYIFILNPSIYLVKITDAFGNTNVATKDMTQVVDVNTSQPENLICNGDFESIPDNSLAFDYYSSFPPGSFGYSEGTCGWGGCPIDNVLTNSWFSFSSDNNYTFAIDNYSSTTFTIGNRVSTSNLSFNSGGHNNVLFITGPDNFARTPKYSEYDWMQNVSVVPNTNYQFSFYITKVSDQLEFGSGTLLPDEVDIDFGWLNSGGDFESFVNNGIVVNENGGGAYNIQSSDGFVIEKRYAADGTTQLWYKLSYNFNSGDRDNITLQIRRINKILHSFNWTPSVYALDDISLSVNNQTGASIEGAATICEGQSTDLTITCVRGVAPYNVEYSFTDGINNETKTIAIPNNNPYNLTVERGGTYTINSVSDASGIPVVINQSVVVTMDPLPSVTGQISGQATVKPGDSDVAYTVPEITNATDYIWEYSGQGATISGTGNSVTVNFSTDVTSGDLSVSGSNECGSVSVNFPITAGLPGSADIISGSSTVCPGQTEVSFSIPEIENATSYHWEYSGTGATIINETTNNILISFAPDATAGNLTVQGVNDLGYGDASAPFPIQINAGAGENKWIRKNDLPADIEFFNLGNLPAQTSCTNGVRGYNMYYGILAEYDPATDSWTRKADYPVNFSSEQSSFAIGDKVYIGLGSGGNAFWAYDIPSNTWTSIADFPGTFNTVGHFTGFSIGAKGYVCRGKSHTPYSELWEYDVVLDIWTKKADLPISVLNASVFVLKGKAYICAGVNADLSPCSNELWEYDPQTDHWERKADFPGQNRYMHIAFAIGDKGYLGAGVTHSGDSGLKDIWEYNANTNSWLKVTDYPGGSYIGLMAFSINGKAYIGGGGSEGMKEFWEYSPTEAQIEGPNSVCPDQKGVEYNAIYSGDFSSFSWQYSGSGAVINNNSFNGITIDYTNATSGDLTLTGINSCGNQVLLFTYPVSVLSVPQATGSIEGSATVEAGDSEVAYTIPPIANATEYTWEYSGQGATISGAGNLVTVSFSTDATSGDLSVRGSNDCGTGEIITFPIVVNSSAVTASISGATGICSGQSVDLIITCSNGAAPYKVSYEYNDGTAITNRSIDVPDNSPYNLSVNQPGTYTLISIEDADGNSSVISGQSVTVSSLSPQVPDIITGTNVVCLNQTDLSYSIPEILNATGYIWQLPEGATIISGDNTNNIHVSFLNVPAGNYNIRVLGTNTCGNGIPSANYPIYVGTQNPIVGEPNDINVCEGANASLSIGAIGQDITYKWSYYTAANGWKYIANATSSSLLVDANVNENGNLYSCYVTSNICGQKTGFQSRSARVSINTSGVGEAGIITGTNPVYKGQTNVEYSVEPIDNATEYVWALPLGATIIQGINTSRILVNYSNNAESGAISVYGKNACGNGVLSENFNLSVESFPDFTATISGSAVADSGDVVPIKIAVTGSKGPYTVFYEYNDGKTIIKESVVVNSIDEPLILGADKTATYTLVSIKDSRGIEVPIIGQTATAHICEREFLSISPEKSSVCTGDELTLEGNMLPEGVFSGNGITDNGDGTAKFKSLTAGEYEITYTYTNTFGCISKTTTSVKVSLKPEVSFSGLNESYLYESSPSILTVNPTGGSFSGYSLIEEQSDGTFKFTPDQTGEFNVRYIYHDGICSNFQSKPVTVYSKPFAVLKGTGIMCDGKPTIIEIHFVGQAPFSFKYTDGTTESALITTSNSSYEITANELGKVYNLTYYKDNRMEGNTSGVVETVYQKSPTASISGNIEICANASGFLPVTFSSSGSIVFNYSINGITQSEIATDKDSYQLGVRYAGTYLLTSVSQRGCEGSVSGSGQVVVNPLPYVDIKNLDGMNLASTYCLSSSPINISASPKGGTYTSFIPEFSLGTDNTASFKPEYPGDYFVAYKYSGEKCENTKRVLISVIEPPSAKMGAAVNYCGDDPGTIEVLFTGTGNYDLEWMRDGETFNSKYDEDGYIEANAAGLYSLVSVKSYGCPGSVSGEATIYKREYPTIDILPVTNKCPYDELNVPVSFTGSAPWTYRVSEPGGDFFNYNSPSATSIFYAKSFGTYKVVSVRDAYCDNKEGKFFEVKEKPLPVVKLTGKGGIFNGQPAKLTVTLLNDYKGAYTFVYSIDGINQPPITTEEPRYTILASTRGKYKLVSLIAAGCNGSVGSGSDNAIDVSEYEKPTVVVKGGCELKVGESMDLSCLFTGSPDFTLTFTVNGGREQEVTFSNTISKLTIYTPGLYKFTKVTDYYGESEISQELLIKPIGENLTCEECIQSFAPEPGQKYVLSAWVKLSQLNEKGDYSDAGISMFFESANIIVGPFKPKGALIDGWQKIEEEFVVPEAASAVIIKLVNSSASLNAYYDDIRLFPFKGNMKSYVYDPVTLKLKAVLDENNYATYYEYDEEGRLIRVKKETERGIKTIQESFNNIKIKN